MRECCHSYDAMNFAIKVTLNATEDNTGNYSDEMTPAISSSLVLKMKKSQQDKDPARGSSQTY